MNAGLDADTAVALIPEGATVIVAGSCGTPRDLVEALARQADRWKHLRVVTPYLYEPLPLFERAGSPFHFLSLHPTPVLDTVGPDCLDTVPLPFSGYVSVFSSAPAPPGRIGVDAALVQVAPPGPDDDGRVSLGPSVGSVVGAVRAARLVIAQVNRRAPYIYGDGQLRPDDRWALVDAETPLTEAPPASPGPAVVQAAARAAALVENGSTVQFGVGAAPAAVATALGHHRHLRLHGGLCTPETAAMIDAGATDGTALAAELAGDAALFGWADRNPALALVEAARSHDVDTLSGRERFVAVNSVIEVALDGAANAEMLGGRRVSGPGGLPDFVAAALRSPGGRSILVLPATAGRELRSRIVGELAAGATTLPAWMADTVVTENGVAELRLRTRAQRSAALAGVADPAFRDTR